MLSRFLCVALAGLIAQPVAADTLEWGAARLKFGNVPLASDAEPAVYGGYARGCLAGAEALEESGPTWQAMRLSRNRNWAHPILLDLLKDMSEIAAAQPGWEGLYIGDLSQPRGGPMKTGHRSHQNGIDGDIWMLPPSRLDLTYREREELSSISVTDDFRTLNSNWTEGHAAVLEAFARHPEMARIFVTAPVKARLCETAGEDRDWLRKIRPWWSHNYHFHIRLRCPEGQSGCVDQAPPPPGDGCDETLAWWMSDEALVPAPRIDRPANAPRPRPRTPLRVADLPAQCAGVLAHQ